MTQKTQVMMILDKSGSMDSVRAETISGVNEQIDVIRKGKDQGGWRVSLITFNDEVEEVYFDADLKALRHLTEADYVPDGMTAMYDAVGYALDRLKKKVTDDNDTSYLVIIISDGLENSSKKYTAATIAKRIQKRQKTERWTFSYLGANQDLTKVADELHIPRGNMAAYASSPVGTQRAFSRVGAATDAYRARRGAGEKAVESFYSPDGDIADIPEDEPKS